MRLINLHVVLIALVAASATASFIPAGERAVAVESGEEEGFFPGTPVPKR
jgi:hypothetical protein